MTSTREGSGNSVATLSLTDFLLARIAEDEEVARAASTLSRWDEATSDWVRIPHDPAIWVAEVGYGSGAVERMNGAPREVGIVVYDEGSPDEYEAAHIARHDPARVLAECAAKRRLVDWHSGGHICEDGLVGERWNDPLECDFMVEDPCDNLRVLGSIYADHPDYRLEWKP